MVYELFVSGLSQIHKLSAPTCLRVALDGKAIESFIKRLEIRSTDSWSMGQ